MDAELANPNGYIRVKNEDYPVIEIEVDYSDEDNFHTAIDALRGRKITIMFAIVNMTKTALCPPDEGYYLYFVPVNENEVYPNLNNIKPTKVLQLERLFKHDIYEYELRGNLLYIRGPGYDLCSTFDIVANSRTLSPMILVNYLKQEQYSLITCDHDDMPSYVVRFKDRGNETFYMIIKEHVAPHYTFPHGHCKELIFQKVNEEDTYIFVPSEKRT